MPLRMYFDPNAQYVITDNWGPTEGQPDAYEGPGAGGEVIAERYIYNTEHATKTYAGITLTAYQDDSVTDLKYALDESGEPGTWLDSITLPDGDYATPYKVWVKCIFAPTSEPIKKTTVKHWIRAEQETLK